MGRTPAPWPEAWTQEYVQTIRQVILSNREIPHWDQRLAILCKGFPPYWEGLKKTQEESLFKAHCAEIRWYATCLMDANLPGDEETSVLRNQYEEILRDATASLLSQFPFLDPNAVHRAEADYLAQCYPRIEAPLLPVYQHLFSQDELATIRSRWHDLRYARVDLWRQLDGAAAASAKDPNARTSDPRRDYLLAQRCLAQVQGLIQAAGPRPPDYYRRAVADHIEVQKRRLQSLRQASAEERRLEKRYSRQVLQTEQIAFLLAALLESAQCLDETSSAGTRGETLSSQSGDIAGGGDTHECK
jgi:hypothetical protein